MLCNIFKQVGYWQKNTVSLFFINDIAFNTSNNLTNAKTITPPTKESIDENSAIDEQANVTSVTIKTTVATSANTLTPAGGKIINTRNKRS